MVYARIPVGAWYIMEGSCELMSLHGHPIWALMLHYIGMALNQQAFSFTLLSFGDICGGMPLAAWQLHLHLLQQRSCPVALDICVMLLLWDSQHLGDLLAISFSSVMCSVPLLLAASLLLLVLNRHPSIPNIQTFSTVLVFCLQWDSYLSFNYSYLTISSSISLVAFLASAFQLSNKTYIFLFIWRQYLV